MIIMVIWREMIACAALRIFLKQKSVAAAIWLHDTAVKNLRSFRQASTR